MDGDCLVDSPKGLDRVQVGFVDKQDLMALREEISLCRNTSIADKTSESREFHRA